MKRSFFFCFTILILTTGAFALARTKTDPIKVGEVAPDFTLMDQNGRSVRLATLNKPALLVFYRGYWCPFCARQLADLRSLPKPEDKFKVFAISVDPTDKSIGLANKIAADGKGELPFPLLSDPGHQTIDAYGLFDPAYAGQSFEGIARATILILDKDRKVLWSSVATDYKKRPSVIELRAAVDGLFGN